MKILITCLAMLLFGLSTPTLGKSHMSGQKDNWMQTLNLTDEQKQKLMSMKQMRQKTMMEIGPKMHDIKQKLNTLVMQKEFDEQQVSQLVGQQMVMYKDMMMMKMKSRHMMYNMLTPEQQQTFKNMMMKYKQQRMQRMNKMQNQ